MEFTERPAASTKPPSSGPLTPPSRPKPAAHATAAPRILVGNWFATNP